MPAFRVVKHLDMVEHVAPRLGAETVNLPTDPLTFEQLEEAFSHGVVVTVSLSTHAAYERVGLQERLLLTARKLTALIRLNHQARRWRPSPDSGQQCFQYQRCLHPRIHCPTDHLT